jgi:hypothetical protein
MTKDERAMLARVAEDDGVTAVAAVRALIRRTYAARWPEGLDPARRPARRRKNGERR